MAEFEDEKRAQIANPRTEGVSPEPFRLAPNAGQGTAGVPAAPASPFLKTPEETLRRWSELVQEVRINPPASREKAGTVIQILQKTKEGIRLIDGLHEVLTRKGKLASRLIVDFRALKDIPNSIDEEEADQQEGATGLFSPGHRYAPRYTIYVGWDDHPSNRTDFSLVLYDQLWNISSGGLNMVETLFHESLHVWFIHKFPTLGTNELPMTGHTELSSRILYDPEFKSRLISMLHELETIENYWKSKRGKR